MLEVNQAVTQLLLKGTVVDGLPDWDQGRPQVVKYIDFDYLEYNDFLVINQFIDFPDLDPNVQVPFVRLILEAFGQGRELDATQRERAIQATLDMVERIRQEVPLVGFWKSPEKQELLTKRLVRDLDDCGLCPPGKEREIAQRLVALARENHEYLVGR